MPTLFMSVKTIETSHLTYKCFLMFYYTLYYDNNIILHCKNIGSIK